MCIVYFNIINWLLVEVVGHLIHVLMLLHVLLVEAIRYRLHLLLGLLVELIKNSQSTQLSLLGHMLLLLVLEYLLFPQQLLLLLVLTPASPIFDLLVKPMNVKLFELSQDSVTDFKFVYFRAALEYILVGHLDRKILRY